MQFRILLGSLAEREAEFVIIGGLAATLHGSARVTYDLDIVYNRTPQNLARIVSAIMPFEPYLRGAPAGLPFKFDVDTLKRGLNFTLTTTAGPLDLLGELAGVGRYDVVRANANQAVMFGATYLFIDLEGLIVAKRAAGRPKDLETIAELEAIRDERRHS